MEDLYTDEYFLKEALKEAKKAELEDEVPVGAVITLNNKIIARGYNMTEKLNDVTAHAEIIAYTAAASFLGAKYLNKCTLYVTLEPCVMCAGALFWSKIGKIVFGAYDEKRGYSKTNENILHPSTEVFGGIMEQNCSQIISSFFRKKR